MLLLKYKIVAVTEVRLGRLENWMGLLLLLLSNHKERVYNKWLYVYVVQNRKSSHLSTIQTYHPTYVTRATTHKLW